MYPVPYEKGTIRFESTQKFIIQHALRKSHENHASFLPSTGSPTPGVPTTPTPGVGSPTGTTPGRYKLETYHRFILTFLLL